jgi:hypothetical protein
MPPTTVTKLFDCIPRWDYVMDIKALREEGGAILVKVWMFPFCGNGVLAAMRSVVAAGTPFPRVNAG